MRLWLLFQRQASTDHCTAEKQHPGKSTLGSDSRVVANSYHGRRRRWPFSSSSCCIAEEPKFLSIFHSHSACRRHFFGNISYEYGTNTSFVHNRVLMHWHVGHAFSRDGLTWNFSETEPYGGVVGFTAGPPAIFSTRERPHLDFADGSRSPPSGVITAVSSQPVGPSCDSCDNGTCSQCKVTEGRDWTFTQFVPFDNFEV